MDYESIMRFVEVERINGRKEEEKKRERENEKDIVFICGMCGTGLTFIRIAPHTSGPA